MNLRTAIVIPARLQSTRLPRKMLLRDTGKTLLQHCYETAIQCRLADCVIIATDSQEIADEVKRFGADARLTSVDHISGTDRVAEVAAGLADVDLIVNLQGDEPEMPPQVVDQVIDLLRQNPEAVISTAACPIRSQAVLHDPSCVKVVMDQADRALYFSRSVIPYPRNWDEKWLQDKQPRFWQHLGIYVYRREFLLSYSSLPASTAEQTESLEQLRALQAGYQIMVSRTEHAAKGIDTPEDYAAFVQRERLREREG